MEQKKLYILTGFLGAGKTSLLLHLLDCMPESKIGVIQNEFGRLGIDGDILRRDKIQMTEISRGSIFCSCLKLSFAQALAQMGTSDLDYIFVESSGLADPSNLEEILSAARMLAGDVFSFQGTLCLIDAVNFPRQLRSEETVTRQLACCNLAVINKADLAGSSGLEEILAAVRRINPVCRITVCEHGRMDPKLLSENLLFFHWAEGGPSLNTEDKRPKTISLECREILSRTVLSKFLERVLPDCYRIKGFFLLDGKWQQVDVVETLVDYKDCPERTVSQLVFLSKVGPQIIRTVDAAWKEIVGLPMKLKN